MKTQSIEVPYSVRCFFYGENKMRNIELLAPAGTLESLAAAINSGADAVYLGGEMFGARKTASFSNDALKKAVELCHLNGVSIYITVNTLIKESEMMACLEYIGFLYELGVDAVILQDIGLMKEIRRLYPDLHCHASTQMTLHSTEDVLYAQSLGFSRVVLARELTIEEILEIRRQTNVELEVFVHGALCISYSGNCLMSSMIGGRSGNRGSCAQPCRKAYELIDMSDESVCSEKEQVYLLSPKDLQELDYVEALKSAGNVSLKIEGRLKGPDYVYNIVSQYRNALDGFDVDKAAITRSFNRQLSTSHMGGVDFKEMMNYEIPSSYGTLLGKVMGVKDNELEIRLFDDLNKGDEIQYRHHGKTVGTRTDVITMGNQRLPFAEKGSVVKVPFKHKVPQNAILYKTYDNNHIAEMDRLSKIQQPKFGVRFEFKAELGERPILICQMESSDKIVKVMSELIVETARNMPLSEERAVEQLSKLGGTPFYPVSIECQLGSGISVPISEINKMRRQCIEQISRDLIDRYPDRKRAELPKRQEKKQSGKGNHQNLAFRVYVDSPAQLDFVRHLSFSGIICMMDLDAYAQNIDEYIKDQIIPVLPKIIRNSEMQKVKTFLEGYFSKKDDGEIVLSHYAHLGLLKPFENAKVQMDESAYIFNSSFFIKNGETAEVELGTSSLELNGDEIGEVVSSMESTLGEEVPEMQIYAYGRPTVMTSEYCAVGGVLAGHDHCGHCRGKQFALRDDRGNLYPLKLDAKVCRMKVLEPLPIYLLDALERFSEMGISKVKVSLEGMGDSEIREVIQEIKSRTFNYDKVKHTRGHFRRGVADF